MENRLQFLHHSEQFATREAAMTYALTEINRGYFSLYAEPLVMKYGDDTENPHIILCIGAKTNDTGIIANNKLCFIDIDKTEAEIVELNEKVDEAIAALTLAVTDTNTVDLTIDDSEGHPNISADVKLAPNAIFNNVVRENILTATNDGVFTYVNLDYDENEEKFIFTVNGVTKEMQILKEDYVVSGSYSLLDESIHLVKKSGDEVIIPMADLINEWKADSGSTTPVVLTRVRHEYEPGNHQDILFGDIRLSNDSRNILEKDDDGKSLIVKGVASNIKYWSGSTLTNVQDAIDAQLKLSADDDNVIYLKGDGLFADVVLTYTTATNTLTFTKSNYTGGTSSSNIQLAGFSFIDGAYYDSATEEIVIDYTDNTGTRKTLRIPVSGIFTEWNVSNPTEGSAIELTKTEHSVSGTDLLSARVLISNEADNIAEIKNNKVYVSKSGITENANKIGSGFTADPHENVTAKFNALSSAVDAEIARATAADDTLAAAISAEETRATTHENEIAQGVTTLENKIGSGFTTGESSNVTAKFDTLSDTVDAEITRATSVDDTLSAAISAEETRATTHENEIAQDVTTLENKIGTGFTTGESSNVTAKFDALSDTVDAEIARATAAETSLSAAIDSHIVNVADTSSVKMTMTGSDNTIKSEVKIGVGSNNIVFTDAVNSGISANVDLLYDTLSNKLTLVTSNRTGGTITKQLQLQGFAFIDNAYYDSTTEELVIEYRDNTGVERELRIPVRDIINEIDVDNTNKTVTLSITKNPASGPDLISANVNVGNKNVFETQILEVIDNKLVVKGEASNIKYSNSDVETTLDALIANDSTHDGQISTLDNKIGTGFTTGESSNVTAKFNVLSGDVSSEITRATNAEAVLDNAISDEVARATTRDTELTQSATTLESKIGTGFTTDPHENITYKFEALSNTVSSEIARSTAKDTELATALNTEENARITKDVELTQGVNDLSAKIGTGFTTDPHENITYMFNSLSGAVTGKVASVDAADSTIIVNNTDPRNPRVKVSLSTGATNILTTDASGVKSEVDLNYSSVTNALTFTVNGNSKVMNLIGATIIDEIRYDKNTESIIINYTKPDGTHSSVSCNVSDLIREWDVNNPTTGSAIELTLSEHSVGGTDKLSARVLVNDAQGNMLEIKNNSLFVSNSGVTGNTARIEALESASSTIEDDISFLNSVVDEITETEGGTTTIVVDCGEDGEGYDGEIR